MTLNLSKHHGLGNDFLIAINPATAPTAEDAVRLCDRRHGIGADGLIALTPFGKGWRMVLHNSDGSRAELSGNGLRCVGQALAMDSQLDIAPDDSHTFAIITEAGPRGVMVFANSAPDVAQVQVAMGKAADGPPVWEQWETTDIKPLRQMGVDMGNPHLVVEVDDPTVIDLAVVGPQVEASYPEGLNVHFITASNYKTIDLRVWERGAGITQACGSGACAAAYAAQQWGLVGDEVEVRQPGGVATVLLDETEGVALRGPAEFVAYITVPQVGR